VLSASTLRVAYAPLSDEDAVPLLDTTLETPFDGLEQLPHPLREGASFGTPRSLHPYLLQNRYGRNPLAADLDCLVLENQHLRATFLPLLGGRLWSLVDRATNRELLYRNQVIQPANLALRNAWFAGGVEWNIATKGHAPHTMSPLHAARVDGADGVPTLRMWEFERLRRVVFQVDAVLPPGSRALFVYIRIRNPNAEAVPMYWWSNAAVPERDDVRVISPAHSAYTTSDNRTMQAVAFPTHGSTDQSWPTRNEHAADYFFDLAEGSRPWIAAVDSSGHGLGQVSTHRLTGRKMFCWGTATGGRRWQSWLSPGGGAYLEIQAGLASTQLEHLWMPGGASWSWLEAYGDVAADPDTAHHDDWDVVTGHVGERMDLLASEQVMQTTFERAAATADTAPSEMLCRGSGWGALERHARARTGQGWLAETGTPFEEGTMGKHQQPWYRLLDDGFDAATAFSDADPHTAPASYVVGEPWERLLSGCAPSWPRDYHLGVMAHAAGDLDAAYDRYSASLVRRPTAWALRGLGRLAVEREDVAAAADLLKSALAMTPDEPSIRFEAITAALDAGSCTAALELVDAAPPTVRDLGRLRLLEARAALACGDLKRVQRILSGGVVIPDMREGDTALSDLWTQAFPGRPVPTEYDFRMR
jgi:hypothetical protein